MLKGFNPSSTGSVVRTNLRRPSMGEGSDDIRMLVYSTVLKGMRFSFAFIICGKGKYSMKNWSSLETLGYPCCVSGRERGWGTTKCRNSTGGIDILSYVAYKLYIAGLDKGLPASQSYKKNKAIPMAIIIAILSMPCYGNDLSSTL